MTQARSKHPPSPGPSGPPTSAPEERERPPRIFGDPSPDRWKVWLAYLALWMIPVVVLTAQRQTMAKSWKLQITFFEEFSWQIAHWYGYALFALYVAQLLYRYPIGHGAGARALLPHVGGMVVFIVARSLAMGAWIMWVLGGYYEVEHTFSAVLSVYSLKHFVFDALMYWMIVGAVQLKENARRQREQELKTSQLQTQLATAQLSALKMQLHPHFLFNTLNAIAALVRTGDNKGAVRMIVGLSELLRMAIDSPRTQIVTLEQELSFLDRYLSIEQVRFPDRLFVTRDIDPTLHDALVPNLILQPLVENAICHGLAPRSEPGHILIRAARDGEDLTLEVCDDGLGLPPGWSLKSSQGVGLSNTRARLAQLYGPRQRFEVTRREGGGVCGRITFPIAFGDGGESHPAPAAHPG